MKNEKNFDSFFYYYLKNLSETNNKLLYLVDEPIHYQVELFRFYLNIEKDIIN